EQSLDRLVDGLHLAVESLDAVADFAHTRLLGAGVLSRLACAANRLGCGVAPRLEIVGLFDETAPLDVLGEDLGNELRAALVRERTLNLVGPLADQPQ